MDVDDDERAQFVWRLSLERRASLTPITRQRSLRRRGQTLARARTQQRKTAESAVLASSAFSFLVARGRNYTWTTGFTVPIVVRVA
jgi:hypothetical protein